MARSPAHEARAKHAITDGETPADRVSQRDDGNLGLATSATMSCSGTASHVR
jgi:hypothetical protein